MRIQLDRQLRDHCKLIMHKVSHSWNLNKIFKDKISSSALRRSYLTNKYGKERDELKEDMIAMASSVEVANNNYIKKT